ncbi:hypothetical protein CONLIGDRAFT_227888 [Coniochaeta ligniaria NRRL 30616]|uniref:Uncharacterized protein n=1 Tax=Coniochaeta ligniaria NRRL 30616 TaxID=1408157 RepID=A0A1J7IVN7_9PEZI|nr:hypothetical protein CONLIGDRAFT_227888 [Coniochaeta ligniaria NRRL 30616]
MVGRDACFRKVAVRLMGRMGKLKHQWPGDSALRQTNVWLESVGCRPLISLDPGPVIAQSGCRNLNHSALMSSVSPQAGVVVMTIVTHESIVYRSPTDDNTIVDKTMIEGQDSVSPAADTGALSDNASSSLNDQLFAIDNLLLQVAVVIVVDARSIRPCRIRFGA